MGITRGLKDYTEYISNEQWVTPTNLELQLVKRILLSRGCQEDVIAAGIAQARHGGYNGMPVPLGGFHFLTPYVLYSHAPSSQLRYIDQSGGRGVNIYGPMRWPELILFWDALGRPLGCTMFGTWPHEIGAVS